jgi:large subunit ribosomal protein L10e
MGLRPARCYHKLKKKPYTRISIHKPRKSFVKGVPAPRIHQFEMGKPGKYDLTFNLVSKNDVQIRSNALESTRITTLKHLNKKLGENNFFLKILIYPHHVLRENAMATGAGADRFSEGMRKSFGKPIGQAARVRKGQKIITVNAPKNSEAVVRKALKRATSKLPGSYFVKMIK